MERACIHDAAGSRVSGVGESDRGIQHRGFRIQQAGNVAIAVLLAAGLVGLGFVRDDGWNAAQGWKLGPSSD
jgi:hypothetical protein